MADTGTNFDTYVVFLPNCPEGVQDGSYHPVSVLALDENDAISRAAAEWYGGGRVQEGAYIVAKKDDLTAYQVAEMRVPSVRSQISLPTVSA